VPNYLIFIDTNILLDFYRVQGRDTDLAILKRIDGNLGRFITTHQVHMEFKKNRQRVILEAQNKLKLPEDVTTIQFPAFLADSSEAQSVEAQRKAITNHIKTLKNRLTEILQEPGKDAVYATLQHLFDADSKWLLRHDSPEAGPIRSRAEDRFWLDIF
jgi:hypothetical protein